MKQALTLAALIAISIALSIAAVVAIERLGDAFEREVTTKRQQQLDRFMRPSDIPVSIEWVGEQPPVTRWWLCEADVLCFDDSAKVR